MPYSLPNDVREALAPGLWAEIPDGDPRATPTHTAADLSDAQLADAIAEADALINASLGRFYVVPVALVNGVLPDPLRWWSRNLAAYGATLTYRRGQDLSDNDPVARRYNATLAALTAVRDGKASLEIPRDTGDTSAAGAGQTINRYAGDLFGTEDFDLMPVSSGVRSRYTLGGFW